MNEREKYLQSLGYTKPFTYWLKPIGYRLFVYLPDEDVIVHFYQSLHRSREMYEPVLGVYDVFRFDYPLPKWEAEQDLGIESFIDFNFHIEEDNFSFDPKETTLSDFIKEAFKASRERAHEMLGYIVEEIGMTRETIRLSWTKVDK